MAWRRHSFRWPLALCLCVDGSQQLGRRTYTGKRAAIRSSAHQRKRVTCGAHTRSWQARDRIPAFHQKTYICIHAYMHANVYVYTCMCICVCVCCATVALRTVLSFIEAALGLYLSSLLLFSIKILRLLH